MKDFMTSELIAAGWQLLAEEIDKPYISDLGTFLQKERSAAQVYPPDELIFNAFKKTPFDKVKVVILGQDPYHGADQANGLAFSVPVGITIPPSLKNIYTELENDIDGFEEPKHGDLTEWAERGVLLLNTALTVKKGEPNSHQKKKNRNLTFDWEIFTDAVISKIAQKEEAVVFMLWGKFAQTKAGLIKKKDLIIESSHPSWFSVNKGRTPFWGSKPFSRANDLLGAEKITWHITPVSTNNEVIA